MNYESRLTSPNFEFEKLVPVFAGIEDSAIQEASSVVYFNLIPTGGGVSGSFCQDLENKKCEFRLLKLSTLYRVRQIIHGIVWAKLINLLFYKAKGRGQTSSSGGVASRLALRPQRAKKSEQATAGI